MHSETYLKDHSKYDNRIQEEELRRKSHFLQLLGSIRDSVKVIT